jgi:hypothetical protein
VAATIVLVDTVPANARFAILRRPTGAPRDVVLLRADADSTDLSDAIWDLLIVRSIDGDTTRSPEHLARLRPGEGDQGQRRVIRWTGRVLSDLQASPPRTVPGVGKVRAVEIWLPPRRHSERE